MNRNALAALKNPSGVTYALSVLTIVCAIWSAIVAFAFSKLSNVVVHYTYLILASLALIAALVFVIGWLDTLTELLNLKASPANIFAYFWLGLLLYFAIFGFNVYQAFKQA